MGLGLVRFRRVVTEEEPLLYFRKCTSINASRLLFRYRRSGPQ